MHTHNLTHIHIYIYIHCNSETNYVMYITLNQGPGWVCVTCRLKCAATVAHVPFSRGLRLEAPLQSVWLCGFLFQETHIATLTAVANHISGFSVCGP